MIPYPMNWPELILLGTGAIAQGAIFFIIYKFRDLIRLGLLFRKELSKRGMLDIDKKRMKLIVDRLANINQKLKDADF